MGAYRYCIRPLLFRFDAERVHQATLSLCAGAAPAHRVLSRLLAYEDPRLAVSLGGLHFPNPVGLGAGFDKNGLAVETLAASGFGFIEVGSVSAHPSAGNAARPRLFRLPRDEALLVYYGVPNEGASVVARRLAAAQPRVPLGVSVVETNTGRPAALESVIDELRIAVRAFVPIADYIALNLHCPNSESGVGPLSDPARLMELLAALSGIEGMPPVFLKVAAATDAPGIDALLRAVQPYPFVRGFILSTLAPRPYAGLRTPAEELRHLPGSLTGAPLKQLARELVAAWYRRVDRARHALVGVGGVQTAADAFALIRKGASLVQLVTALVYEGPGLAQRINRGLATLLEREGIGSIGDAVGVDCR